MGRRDPLTAVRRLATLAPIAVALTAAPEGAGAQDVPVEKLPTVEVIATTPLPGPGTPASQVPGNVQSYTGREIGRQRPSNLADFLDANPSSVSVNSPSGNPFQSDVSFRGFTASPLLGTPQGLSVFVDGVRINEVFGDVVNWDLIPTSAIARVELIPGSNPVFGLNTLGGALAVSTKNGAEYPGASVEASAGSFGRRTFAFEAGGSRDALDGYAAGNLLDETGWRDHSPSRIRQFFGKSGWAEGDSEAAVSLSLADNHLSGTQALPLPMLSNPRQAYTWPDTTGNRLAFVNATGLTRASSAVVVSGNAYYRGLSSDGVNSNVNGEYDPASPDSPAAFNVASAIDTRGAGASLQATLLTGPAGRRNRLTVGAAADLGDAGFQQSQQPAAITPQRETVGIAPYLLETDAETQTWQYGIYATDTYEVSDTVAMTVSARYNYARITINDRTGETPALNGDNRYHRVNPAAGATWAFAPGATAYASWSQGMRVPSPVELTCADPDAPCTLPNIFVADPPLKPVIGTTVEIGARGRWTAKDGAVGSWNAAVYRTDLQDDIQFIAAGSGAANSGYFRNIGGTRREGVELGGSLPIGPVTLTARYSYLRATFQTGFVENSPNNSSAAPDGTITVNQGDRIPGVPAQLFKLRAQWDATSALALGANLVAAGSQYARGDENNLDDHGPVPGYAVMNLDAQYRLDANWQLFANVTNVFNARYQNFGILGVDYFRGPGNAFAPALAAPEQFRTPGAPFGVWIGVRYSPASGRS